VLCGVTGDYGGLFLFRHGFREVVNMESENTWGGFVCWFRQGSKDRKEVLALYISFYIDQSKKANLPDRCYLHKVPSAQQAISQPYPTTSRPLFQI